MALSQDADTSSSTFVAALLKSTQPSNLTLQFYSQEGQTDTRRRFLNAQQLHSSLPIKHAGASRVLVDDSQPSLEANIQLRNIVWKELKERLLKVNVSLDGLSQRMFSWLLPRMDASQQDWDAFLDNPLLVDTSTLKTMFNLEQSTSQSPVDTSKDHLVYIRTFAFTVEILTVVLQDLIEDGMPHDVLLRLLRKIHGLAPDQVVFVRYAGQTTSGCAFNRHYKDLTHRGQTFMTYFLQATLRIAPEVIDAVEVYEFTDATIYDYPVFDTDLADKREQALIALFDRTSVINIQDGGKSRIYHASSEDEDQFITFNTSLSKNFGAKCTTCPDQVLIDIRRYVFDAQQYARNHPESTGFDKYPITDAVRNMLYDQAVPAMINDHALMVSVGSDIPPDAVVDVSSFYGGKVAAGNICNTVFDQLASWEFSEYTKVKTLAVRFIVDGRLPFVDLFPWTKKSDSDFLAAVGGLRSYFQATKPLIILTYGHRVASAAAGSFQHPNGLKESRFAEAVGKLIMTKYDEDPADTEDENCCISIPCYHPGTVAHNAPTWEIYLKIIGKVLTLVWLAMDVAVRLAGNGKLTKRRLCQKITTQVNYLAGPDTDFGQSLEALKSQLKDGLAASYKAMGQKTKHARVGFTTQYQALQAGREAAAQPGFSISYDTQLSLTTSRNRWQKAKEELYAVLTCELAAPQALRNSQIRRIAGMHLALLEDATVGRNLEQLARGVAANRLYYLEFSSMHDRLKDVPNLMSIHLDQSYNPNTADWKSNPSAVAQADKNMVDWLVANFAGREDTQDKIVNKAMGVFTKLLGTKDHALSSRLRAEISQAVVPDMAHGPFQGCRVHIHDRHGIGYSILSFKWTDVSGMQYELRDFGLPLGVLPLHASDARYLFFVEGGLDIRDVAGNTLGLLRNRRNTVPLSTIHTTIRDSNILKAFLALWEKETGLDMEEQMFGAKRHIATSTAMVYPKSFFRTGGRPWNTSWRSKKKILEDLENSKPIQPEDAVWLLHKFLEEYYPNVGDVVDAGKSDVWPESDTVWPKLKA